MSSIFLGAFAGRLFFIFLVILVIPGIQCLNRHWDNPMDPEYQSTWVKFTDTPWNIGILSENLIFSFNGELFFASMGSSYNIYKYRGGVGWITITGNPSVNYRFDAVTFQDRLYFLAGVQGRNNFTVYYFDPSSSTFSQEVQIAKTNGMLHTISSCGSRLIVFEADTAEGGKTSLHELNPATGALTYISSCPHIHMEFACAGVSDEIYLIGGMLSSGPESQGEQTALVEAYNFSTHSWSQKADIPVKGNLLVAADAEDAPYVFDGNSGSMFKFLANQNTWEQKTGYQLIYKGIKPSLTVHEGIIFVALAVRRSSSGPTNYFEIFVYHYKND